MISVSALLIASFMVLSVTQALGSITVKNCGVSAVSRNPKIIRGQDALKGEFPWQVSFRYENEPEDVVCSGALLNERWIISAAHCFVGHNKDRIRVGIGVTKISDKKYVPHKIKEIRNHEGYNGNPIQNDIAVVKLEKPVTLNEFVNGICLPTHADRKATGYATVTGWGRTIASHPNSPDNLQAARVPLQPPEICAKYFPFDSTQFICAGGRGKGACMGDSGGPLIIQGKNGTAELLGISSYGKRNCGTPGIPEVYTRVGHFLEWLKENVKGNEISAISKDK